MKNPKKLNRNQKEFLSKQGLNSKDFLISRQDSESYTFYNVKTGKLLPPMRR